MPKIQYVRKADGERILNRSFCQKGDKAYKFPILALIAGFMATTEGKTFTISELAKFHLHKSMSVFDIDFSSPPIGVYTKQGENEYGCSVHETNELILDLINKSIAKSGIELLGPIRKPANLEYCIIFNNQYYLITDLEVLINLNKHLQQQAPIFEQKDNGKLPELLEEEFSVVSSIVEKIKGRIEYKLKSLNNHGEIYYTVIDGKTDLYTPNMSKITAYSNAKDSYIRLHMSDIKSLPAARSTKQTGKRKQPTVSAQEPKPVSLLPQTQPSNAFNDAFFYLLKMKSQTAIRFTRQELAAMVGYFSDNNSNNNNAQNEHLEKFIKKLESENLLISVGNGEYCFNPPSPKKPTLNNNVIASKNTQTISTPSPEKRPAPLTPESPRKRLRIENSESRELSTRRNLNETFLEFESGQTPLSNSRYNVWEAMNHTTKNDVIETTGIEFEEEEIDIQGLINSPPNT